MNEDSGTTETPAPKAKRERSPLAAATSEVTRLFNLKSALVARRHKLALQLETCNKEEHAATDALAAARAAVEKIMGGGE